MLCMIHIICLYSNRNTSACPREHPLFSLSLFLSFSFSTFSPFFKILLRDLMSLKLYRVQDSWSKSFMASSCAEFRHGGPSFMAKIHALLHFFFNSISVFIFQDLFRCCQIKTENHTPHTFTFSN